VSDDLAPVIEAIGQVYDREKRINWQIADDIYNAFEELPRYTQGLLQGLCLRLAKSSTQIYNYSKAMELKKYINSFKIPPELSVSHYARMCDLQKQFDLTYADCYEYLSMAEEGWSVRQLAMEVTGNHEPAPDEVYRRKFQRFTKLMRSLWNDPQFGNVAKETRAVYYDLMQELEKINGN